MSADQHGFNQKYIRQFIAEQGHRPPSECILCYDPVVWLGAYMATDPGTFTDGVREVLFYGLCQEHARYVAEPDVTEELRNHTLEWIEHTLAAKGRLN